MNAKIKAVNMETAAVNQLCYDEQTGIIFGYRNGYAVYVVNNQQGQLTVSVSVSKYGAPPVLSELKALAKQSKLLTGCVLQRFKVTYMVRYNRKNRNQNLNNAIQELTGFLFSNGYVNCCQNCGRQMPTAACAVAGCAQLLCEECFAGISMNADQQMQKQQSKQVNIVGGIVGALIGSILGAGVIVLLGQMGYVAALSGIVMAVCTIKGYEMLGGKMNAAGIVISTLIMVGMVYVGNRVDLAITVAEYFEVGFGEAFRAIPELLKEGYIDSSYAANLVLTYMFTAGGAVPTIVNAVRNSKVANVTMRLTPAGYMGYNK